MRITGTGNVLPPNVARAYGVTNPRPALQATAPSNPAALAQISPVASTHAASVAPPPNAAHNLVAGQVPGPITFDGLSVPRATHGALHLYTRAADKIEAATAIQIGRTLDIKG